MHATLRRSGVAVLAAAVPLLAPVAAQAATKTVHVGRYGKAANKAFGKAGGDANAYFRKVVTVHAGDKVTWSFGSNFHSVTFVPKGGKPPAFITVNPTKPVSGVNDAAGMPFWFNGQPSPALNPLAFAKQGGRTFNPAVLENSGLPLGGPPKPYTLKFPKAGTYNYICVIHPGMRGTVRVLAKGKSVPTARQDAKEATREQTAVLRNVQRLTTGIGTTKLGTATVQAGNDRKSGETVFKFFPSNPKIPAGKVVTLQIAPRSTEAHTFTFGPSQYVNEIANGFGSPSPDPRAVYPSEDPAAGVPSINLATNHGNGYYNTGVLDADGGSPLPNAVKVRFTQPGTYSYICLIHPFMRGQITVTAP